MDGLSWSVAHGIFSDPGWNLCLLHWQVDSLPLSHQGSPAYLCRPGLGPQQIAFLTEENCRVCAYVGFWGDAPDSRLVAIALQAGPLPEAPTNIPILPPPACAHPLMGKGRVKTPS